MPRALAKRRRDVRSQGMNTKPFVVTGISSLFVTAIALLGSLDALAQSEAAAPDPMRGLLLNLPIFAALFALFYFGLIRPQRAQQKKLSAFLTQLQKGQEVITSGGIIGRVVGITDRVVTLEVAPGMEFKILRAQIQANLKDSLPNG